MELKQKVLFLLIGLSSSVQILSAQAYKPMLAAKNEWQVTICAGGCLTDTYFTADDTIVNGKTYSILDGYHYISRHFLVREELNTKKIYLEFIQNGRATGEVLLYDFSMQVGDSIDMNNPISPFPPNAGYFRLDSIVSRTLFDGEDYRHFYLTPLDTTQAGSHSALWIESIGSLVLLNTPGGEANINSAGHLSCMFKDGELIYSNTDSIAGCSEVYFLNGEEGLKSENTFSIYPTITQSQVSIQSENILSSLQLSSISGELLEVFHPEQTKEFTIDLSNYETGIYILNILDSKTTHTHQLLIKQ